MALVRKSPLLDGEPSRQAGLVWEYNRLFVEVVSEIRKIALGIRNISSRDKNVEVPRV